MNFISVYIWSSKSPYSLWDVDYASQVTIKLQIIDCSGLAESRSKVTIPDREMTSSGKLAFTFNEFPILSRVECGFEWTYHFDVVKGNQNWIEFFQDERRFCITKDATYLINVYGTLNNRRKSVV